MPYSIIFSNLPRNGSRNITFSPHRIRAQFKAIPTVGGYILENTNKPRHSFTLPSSLCSSYKSADIVMWTDSAVCGLLQPRTSLLQKQSWEVDVEEGVQSAEQKKRNSCQCDSPQVHNMEAISWTLSYIGNPGHVVWLLTVPCCSCWCVLCRGLFHHPQQYLLRTVKTCVLI